MAINFYQRLRQWSRAIKWVVQAVYPAAHDLRVPWCAKSPIDLIPEIVAEHLATAAIAATWPVSQLGAAAPIAVWILKAAGAAGFVFDYFAKASAHKQHAKL